MTTSRYGYLVMRGTNGFDLAAENGQLVQQYGCGTASCDQRTVAVSPDGKRVAYWRAGQAPGWELRVFDVAAPTNVRTVVALPETQKGGALVWSTDSQGVAYGLQSAENNPGIGGGPKISGMSAVDLTGAQAQQVDAMPSRTDGVIFLPVVWDRTKKLFAAVVTGEGGFIFEYDTNDPSGGYKQTRASGPGQMIAGQVEASPDGARLLAIDISANVLRIWPVTNFGAQDQVRPAPGATRITAAHWRSSTEVGWSYSGRFDVFTVQTDSVRTVYKAESGELTLVGFRADGSGALIAQTGGDVVIDLAGGMTPSTIPANVPVVSRGVVFR